MIEKPAIALAVCGGLFTICALTKIATLFQCAGMISAGTMSMIILFTYLRKHYRIWRDK